MCNAKKGRRRSIIEAEATIAFLDEVQSSNSSDEDYSPSEEKKERRKPKTSTKTKTSKNGETKRREIQHNYHDHADDDGAVYRNTPMVSKGGVTVPFPMKLHNMLEHIAQNETHLSSIVTWQPHGRSFIVQDINKFAEEVLPRFFQQKKYASFQRQLNLYGFTRLTKGPDRGSYYHELFLRSKKILCRGIVRMKIKGTGSRMASNPEQEPNFYQMAFMPGPGNENNTSGAAVKSVVPIKIEDMLPPTASSSVSSSRCEQSSSKSVEVPVGTQYFKSSPQDRQQQQTTKNDSVDEDMKEIDFVFENMPFYGLDNSDCARRHSLMDIQRARRLSAQFLSKRGSLLRSSLLLLEGEGRRSSCKSIVLADEDFQKDMEAICQLGQQTYSDQDMCGVLEKIVNV